MYFSVAVAQVGSVSLAAETFSPRTRCRTFIIVLLLFLLESIQEPGCVEQDKRGLAARLFPVKREATAEMRSVETLIVKRPLARRRHLARVVLAHPAAAGTAMGRGVPADFARIG